MWTHFTPILLSLSMLFVAGPDAISTPGIFSVDNHVYRNNLKASEDIQPGQTETIKLVGTYHWQLVLDIVNNNNTEFVTSTEYKTTTTASYDEIVTTTWNAGVKANLNFNMSFPLLTLVGLSLSGNVAPSVSSAYTNTMTTKKSFSESVTKTTNITIKANTRYTLYQQVFVGPGVTQALDSLSFEKKPDENVTITVQYQRMYFLKGIDVVRVENEALMPPNVVQELYRKQPNINSGFDDLAPAVFLVPKWTSNPAEALTALAVVVQKKQVEYLKDMGEGISGDSYRYLIPQLDANSANKITSVGLVRRSTIFTGGESMGWQRCSIDINSGRHMKSVLTGSYLYLCWNTSPVGRPTQRATASHYNHLD